MGTRNLARGRSGIETGSRGIAFFAEAPALRLLLIKTVGQLLRGEEMTPEQFKEMLGT
jgi:hypothetical protein